MNFPSPNCNDRRDGQRPALVVLHFTALESFEASRDWMCDPARQVSAHWLIDCDGRAEQLVDEARRAWHAGAGAWQGQGDVNSRSIGIELQNTGDEPFPEPQMAALERLLAAIMARWQIAPEAVIAHSDLAPERKSDPGPRFDWRRLAHQGLSIWPKADVAAKDAGDFYKNLRAFGYPKVSKELLLRSFRLRFHPWGEGAPNALECAMAADLARRFGKSV